MKVQCIILTAEVAEALPGWLRSSAALIQFYPLQVHRDNSSCKPQTWSLSSGGLCFSKTAWLPSWHTQAENTHNWGDSELRQRMVTNTRARISSCCPQELSISTYKHTPSQLTVTARQMCGSSECQIMGALQVHSPTAKHLPTHLPRCQESATRSKVPKNQLWTSTKSCKGSSFGRLTPLISTSQHPNCPLFFLATPFRLPSQSGDNFQQSRFLGDLKRGAM